MSFYPAPGGVVNGFGENFSPAVVKIESGATTSSSQDLGAQGLVGIIMPAAFTGTAITFQGSMDNVTFTSLYNSNNSAYSITVSASRYYILWPADFLGCRSVRIVSNGAEGALREITLVMRSFS